MLDWLGDCGGLLDMVTLIAQYLVAPFSAFAMKTRLMTLLVRFAKSDKTIPGSVPADLASSLNKESKDVLGFAGLFEHIKKDFQRNERIRPQNFFLTLFASCLRGN